MAFEDRDRTFEKALARHLRSSAVPGVDANAPGAGAREPCPDPETLAAYHDGALSSEERNLWNQHVVSCENCQSVLAHLETPLDLPVNVAAQDSARTALPAPVSVSRPRRSPSMRWLWLVPAGAVAASLVVWISLHEQKPWQVAQPPAVEIAENRQAPGAAPSAPPVRVVPRERQEEKEKDKVPSLPQSIGGIAAASAPNHDSAANNRSNQVQLNQPASQEDQGHTPHGPSLLQKQQQASRFSAGAAGGAIFDQKKLDAQASLKVQGRAVEAGAPPAAPPPPSSSEPSFVDDGTVTVPSDKRASPAPAAPAAPTSSAAQAQTGAIGSVTETVEVRSAAPELHTAFAAVLEDPRVFAAPGGKKHLWRVGPAGSLEFSKDQGAKWMPQVSGVTADLLAGSAPSAKVAWIVGKAGTILRTTDGGAHWNQLDSPVTVDLGGVRATDATHAIIWLLPENETNHVKSFQTDDGGVTWRPAPSK